MDFVSDLRMKAARQRAWQIGNPAWMRQWLLDEARRSTSSALEFKSGYAALCRDMAFRYGGAPEVKVGNPHWEEQPRVPRGNFDGGEWTRLAGDAPGLGHNQGPPLDDLPELPNELGGVTPREYLKGKDWDEKTRVGLDALRIHGVLK